MIPLTASFSGSFLRQIEARATKWRGTKIAVRIKVPPELSWWYWQEFGTATRGDAGRASGKPYDILPVNAKALSFPGPNGDRILTGSVRDHPGIKPRRLVESIRPEIRAQLLSKAHEAFKAGAGDQPALLKEAMFSGTEQAKTQIVESIADKLPGTRADGRLHGGTAASAFEAAAQVVDITE